METVNHGKNNPDKIGSRPLFGNFEKEGQTQVKEVVLILGGPFGEDPYDLVPSTGYSIPSKEEIRLFPSFLPENIDLKGVGQWGLSRIIAATSYYLHKQKGEKWEGVLPIFTCGFSGHEMAGLFNYLAEDAPHLIEDEAWDTSTNIEFTLGKIREYYPLLYERILDGTVPITIITSGLPVSDRLVPYGTDNDPNWKNKPKQVLAGLSNYGTHTFRVALYVDSQVRKLRSKGAKIRVLPSDMVINDLAWYYKINNGSDTSEALSSGRGIDELFFNSAIGFTIPDIAIKGMRLLARVRTKDFPPSRPVS